MKEFLLSLEGASFWKCWGIAILIVAAWNGWKSVRRMLRYGRRKFTEDDARSPDYLKFTEMNLPSHPIYGDPTMLVIQGHRPISELGQFFKRWLTHYPLAWFVNVVLPFTWILSLPLAFVFWYGLGS